MHHVQTFRCLEDLKLGSCGVSRDEKITQLDVGARKLGKMAMLT